MGKIVIFIVNFRFKYLFGSHFRSVCCGWYWSWENV